MNEEHAMHLTFWGKTRRTEVGFSVSHPVGYHSLDVAAVASVLLSEQSLSSVDAAFHPLFLTLIAWHDIGKFTRTFQCKAPEHWPVALGRFHEVRRSHGHDTAGYGLLLGQLESIAKQVLPRSADSLLRAACGHHGRPPLPLDLVSREEACDVCVDAARQFAVEAAAIMSAGPPPTVDRKTMIRLTWQLAGLTVLADWIGSNEYWFAAQPTQMPLAQYWTDHALPQARIAVGKAGIVPAWVAPGLALTDLAAHATTPTPLQHMAQTLVLPATGPLLVVIEDQTGAGKTEAALLLAHRLMLSGQAHGLFVALPTMATANAMYARLAGAYRALFAADAEPSLVLAHGRRGLHAGFRKSILPVPTDASEAAAIPADETAEAQCAAWVASDRRRAFLADVGVGTIDQALLAILPSRHAALRLLGLSQRVLIVDEAHAYDAYMLRELETLVAFHAGLGGSTIILSATLPRERRGRLVAAFHSGAGGAPPALASEHYPLVTLASVDATVEQPCAPRAELGRDVVVERLSSTEDTVSRIIAAAKAGLAVAWVRNAVDDAIGGHAALRAAGIEADLFHARFAMGDRLAIEAAAMERFGRTATQAMRGGRVLVATQVIEQSLDLDFDLMVSDLAPIDLLIQRAGRLWRHERKDRPVAAPPRFLVISPEATDDADGKWLSGPLQRTRHIYRWSVLWRTARELFTAGMIVTPGGVRALVENVYSDPEAVPDGLKVALADEQGKESAAISMAKINVLAWKDAYVAGQGWDSDVRTPTRLTEESTVFRLARWENDVLTPWFADGDPRLAWALSEVSLAAWRASGVPAPTGALAGAVAVAKAGWGRWDQETPLLVLVPSDGGWEGNVIKSNNDKQVVRYRMVNGLTLG
jgi:CRISPR-associated endonuclease/helicase Cas3